MITTYHKSRFDVFAVEDRLGAECMHGFAQTPDGAIWLSGELGIGRYDGTWRYWTTQQGLRRNGAFVMAAAPDGTVFLPIGSTALVSSAATQSIISIQATV